MARSQRARSTAGYPATTVARRDIADDARFRGEARAVADA